jgi:hypothetical protein
MPTLADLLTPRTAREYLLRLITTAAINDADFRAKLIADPSIALKLFFGRTPPTDRYDFRVVVEDPSTYYFVIPQFGLLREVAAPPTIAPRTRFEGRLNAILREAPGRIQAFEANPHGFIAEFLNFRLPHSVDVVPLREAHDAATDKDVVYVVLKYPPHDGLFTEPYALRFERPTSEVEVAPSPSLSTPEALTVEAWLRAAAFEPGNWQNAVVSRHGQAAGWELRVGEAIPRFMVTVDGIHRYAQPATPEPLLVPGRWYYVAGVYDGQALQLWLEGSYMYGTPVSGTITEDPGRLTVGNNSNPDWKDRNFQGEVDEVRVWGRSLTADEIRRGHGRKPRALPESGDTLRVYFPCSEGNGTIVHDQSGSGNDGTLRDVDWVAPLVTGS